MPTSSVNSSTGRPVCAPAMTTSRPATPSGGRTTGPGWKRSPGKPAARTAARRRDRSTRADRRDGTAVVGGTCTRQGPLGKTVWFELEVKRRLLTDGSEPVDADHRSGDALGWMSVGSTASGRCPVSYRSTRGCRVPAGVPLTLDQSPAGLATLYGDIGQQLASHVKTAAALAAVAQTAVARVPGAQWASITRGRNGSFETV